MSLRQRLFGKPRDLRDPKLFHNVSLIAFFAWVGLGADGLSSSAYGPDEAFKALEGHYYLAIFLAVALALTVFIISYGYSRIIEQFPSGGGGYVVASKLLGERAGLVSGCALLVDYVLTITTSVASGANAVFAFLPASLHEFKFATEVGVIVLLVIMNIRGVKESVQVLTPIFLAFLFSHVILVFGAIFANVTHAGALASQVHEGLTNDLELGKFALLMIFFRAYSLGGSSYTGIEAVSNGLAIMREPRVQTAQRTMVLMATSLALIAGGILLSYMLVGVEPVRDAVTGKIADVPMNAILVKKFSSSWHLGHFDLSQPFVILTLFSEGALLFVAAQTGFLDGPRVMANMAVDSWMPHQFSALSERLTMHNGVYLMGGAALATLFYTRGSIDLLTVMYSINVFVTFSLSNLGMCRLWLGARGKDDKWRKHFAVHLVALILCVSVLFITVIEKFSAGGWVTLVVTSIAIGICWAVRMHYRMIAARVRKLNQELQPMVTAIADQAKPAPDELDPEAPTAVLMVGSYGPLGVSCLLQIDRVFPGQFRQVVFVSAGVVDSGTFKGAGAIDDLRASLTSQLEQYKTFAMTKLGWAADSDLIVGTEAVEELERLCREVSLRFPRSVFFAGKLIVREPTWWHRLLHNETAHAVQRRLEFARLPMVVLPVRVLG